MYDDIVTIRVVSKETNEVIWTTQCKEYEADALVAEIAASNPHCRVYY